MSVICQASCVISDLPVSAPAQDLANQGTAKMTECLLMQVAEKDGSLDFGAIYAYASQGNRDILLGRVIPDIP